MTMRRVSSIYPGWWLAIGACFSLGLVAGMSFWAFGLFVEPLQSEFGWSPSILGGAVSLSLLVSGLASPIVGRLVDRYQPRRVILIGSLATVGGYVLLSRVQELWQFLALMAFLAFFRAWIFYVPFTTLITRWFARRRATAMGIATSGFGLGGLLFLPLMAGLLDSVGWRTTFLIAALLVLVINGLFVVFVRNDPAPIWLGHEAAETTRASVPTEGVHHFEQLRDVYRAPVFWLAAAGFSLFFFAQWAFLYHAPQLLQLGGLASRDAAGALAASAGLGIALRLATGAALDRIIRLEFLAAGVLGVMALALAVLATGTALPAMSAFVVLWGVGSGLGPALEPMLVGRLFGRKHYGSVYGAMDGIDTVVSIPGPWLGGIVFDLFGSYAPVLVLYAVAFVVGGVSFGLLPRFASGNRRTKTSARIQPDLLTPSGAQPFGAGQSHRSPAL
jgi:sugar phosphate permease